MPSHRQPGEVARQIEELLERFRAVSDPQVQRNAEQLVRLLVEFYGTGLERIVQILEEEASAGEQLIRRLARDEVVGPLLTLHDLHPDDLDSRIRAALDKVQPYLASHGGSVEYLGVDDAGVVQLRLQGSCHGCPSSLITVKLAIERSIEEVAPEVMGVAVEGMVPDRAVASPLIPVDSIRWAESSRPVAGPSGKDGTTWVAIPGLEHLAPGSLQVINAEGNRLLVCAVGGETYAYRDTCPSCASPLDRGQLNGVFLTCPNCRQTYNIRRAGQGVDDRELHLDPLPLLTRNGQVEIALPRAQS